MTLRNLLLAGAVLGASPAVAQTTTMAIPTASAPGPGKAAATASSGGQVAEVVDQEFASYDTDHDGKLDKAEFGAWMVRLKAMSDPSAKVGTPATTAWVNSAFSQADADRNRVLTKTELTGFLTRG